jgi:hypothetical protein
MLRGHQNVPSIARVAAGAFGFLIFNYALDGADLYGTLSLPIRSPNVIALSRGRCLCRTHLKYKP